MAAFSKWVNRKLRGIPASSQWFNSGHAEGWSSAINVAQGFENIPREFQSYSAPLRKFGRGWTAPTSSQVVGKNVAAGFEALAGTDLGSLGGVRSMGRGASTGWAAGMRGAENTWNPWYKQVNKWVGNYKPGVSSTRRTVSRALKSPGSPLSLAFGALAAYQGYQEGGISGAASYVAQGAAFEIGSSLLAQTIGATGAGLLGAGAAVTMGTYEALEYGNRYMKRRTRSEMSAPFVDKFGTLATMRQRSLQAMRDSHLNMRSALGNEATLMHR